jgi:PAS domain S-box-containing protein
MPDLRQFPTLHLELQTAAEVPDISEILDNLHSSKTPMWIFGTETLAFLEVNEAATRRYGYTREEFLRMTILDIRPVEDVSLILRDELRDRKHFANAETWRHKRRRGRVFQVRITSHELKFRGRIAEIVTAERVSGPESELPG